MTTKWAKLPIDWIRYDDKLRLFTVGDIGASIAALKIYIALVLAANFEPNKRFNVSGCASISYSEFEELTGMSRATVALGIRKLKDLDLIVVETVGRPNVYRLTNYDSSRGWGKLPKKYFYGTLKYGQIQKVVEFSMRHRAHLNAIRVYLLFHAFRSGTYSQVSYDKITEYTGISRGHIHPAISILVDLQLVSISEGEISVINGRPPNKYHILGLKE